MANHTRKVPCESCGSPTQFRVPQRCNNCWEVERLLPEYLRSRPGREFVAAALEKAEKEEGGESVEDQLKLAAITLRR